MSGRTVHALGAGRPATITVEDTRVVIRHLEVDDPGLAGLLRSHPQEEHEALVGRALGVGARGLATMGLGIDVAAVDARIRSTLEATVAEAERRIADLMEAGAETFQENFDPQRRTSLLSRAMEDFADWRDGLLASLDPAGSDSHTTRFLQRLTELLGPQGPLEERLRLALDPEADGSALARLGGAIDERFTELRDLIVYSHGRDAGRDEEWARGTAQGFDYEDVVEARLRAAAAALGGTTVERVSRSPGLLGPQATVGDFVVTLPDGYRVVVEAKNQATLTLTGKDGVLGELDRAMDNRQASFGICVSSRDAYPAEVGGFGVYGDRALVVDDGEGTMLGVALRWACAALAAASRGSAHEMDSTLLTDRLDRIRSLADRFRTMQSSLTNVGKTIESVKETLREMRAELIDLVDEARRQVLTDRSLTVAVPQSAGKDAITR